MNYDTYVNNKKKNGFFDFLKNFDFFENVQSFAICLENVRKCWFVHVFWCCWCMLYNELLFWIRLSDSVYLSVYTIIFWRYVWTFLFKNVPDVWTNSVRSFVWDVGGCLVLNGLTSCSIREYTKRKQSIH